MNQLISVIVPVYNVENYLRECLDSIVSQTYRNLEIIVVDDGSVDSSGKICDEYAEKDARIKVIHKGNGGLSDARNAGIEVANGDYIGFVDSDDVIDEKMYECLLKLCIETNADVSMCKIKRFKGKTEKYNVVNEQKRIFSTKEEIIREVCCGGNGGVSACIKLFKMALFTEMRFLKGKTCEDAYLIPEFIRNTNKMVVINNAYYYYRIREGSITEKKKFSTNFYDLVNAWKIIYESLLTLYPSMKSCLEYRLFWAYRESLLYMGGYVDKEKYVDVTLTYQKELRRNIIKILLNENNNVQQKIGSIIAAYSMPMYYCLKNVLNRK